MAATVGGAGSASSWENRTASNWGEDSLELLRRCLLEKWLGAAHSDAGTAWVSEIKPPF